MKRKAVSGIMLTLLFLSILPFVFYVQPVNASGTIYIRADGSIDPPTANITTADNFTYYFTDNNYDSIVVERDNIVVDGAGYTLQGPGHGDGIYLVGRSNVTIKNIEIKLFSYAVYLNSAFDCIISGNNITDNSNGFILDYSSGNTVSENNITNAQVHGVHLAYSNRNVISGNNVLNSYAEGVELAYSNDNIISGNTIADTHAHGGLLLTAFSSNNTVFENTIINNDGGGLVFADSPGNQFYHNNFIDNDYQVYIDYESFPNVWDYGYPSGGNYWSHYGGVDLYSGPYQNETGSDGIGDTPVGIGANDTDFYPLSSPYPFIHAISIECTKPKTALAEGYSTKLYFQVANAHFTETVNVTAYVNSTVVDSLTNVTVPSGNSTVTLTWNATSLAKGNYNLSIYATPVSGELFTKDNTYTHWVLITIVGDVDGDRDVDVGDQRKVQLAMFSVPDSPSWDPNADIDCDEDVDVGDQRKQQLHMFESW